MTTPFNSSPIFFYCIIDIALAQGVKFGRPKIEKPDNFNEIVSQWKNKDITARQVMRLLNLKPNTFYNMVNEDK